MERKQVEQEKLRLMVFKNALELGKKVDEHLLKMYNIDKDKYTFIIPTEERPFDDGHLKVEIEDTVRGKDMFLLTDIGNYSMTYLMHGINNHMSPNDYMMQLLDGIGACNSHANKINVVMPLLYAGRQHRRNTRENLMCGFMLHILDMNPNIKSIVTFDAHDQGVEHALHYTELDNFFPSNVISKRIIEDVSKEDLSNIIFVAPDNGANARRNIYLNSFISDYVYVDAGSFYKLRDYNKFVDGKNPVISHEFCGNEDLKGKTAIVSDDMISSGGSIVDVINELKKRGIKKIYIVVTYALFTRGIGKFKQLYNDGMFDAVYTTNLSYIPEEYKNESWLHVCDCSKEMATIIYKIHNEESISSILRDKSEPIKLLKKKFEDE